MKEIPLTQGKVALVDDKDFERVNQFKWYARLSHGHWYAERNVRLDNGKRTRQCMHRFIMGLEYGDPRQVDHRDRVNTLDNRRQNLRITLDQNSQNRGSQNNNTSGFKGVSLYKATPANRMLVDKWTAQIRHHYKQIHLGMFPTPELAARAYDAAALHYHGEFAVTNASLGLLPPAGTAAVAAAATSNGTR